jgi:hypothetical protein
MHQAARSKPADETLRDEYVIEASYIYQWSKNLSLTPDIQIIIDPADNPAESKVCSMVGFKSPNHPPPPGASQLACYVVSERPSTKAHQVSRRKK